jgi:hypothetical protein
MTSSVASRTSVGTGRSARVRPEDAVAEALSAARNALSGEPDACVFFATVGYDPHALTGALRAQLPAGCAVVGCSGEGVTDAHGSDEDAHALVVMLFASDRIGFTPVFASGLRGREVACAEDLAAQIRQVSDARVVVLLPDGLTGNLTTLVEALDAAVPGVLFVGGAAGDMLTFERTWQYAGEAVVTDGVAALVLSGAIRAAVRISHGCAPIGRERVVTKSQGALVQEIDGVPVWKVFQEYIGVDRDELEAADSIHLCIGRPLAKTGTDEYPEYVIRMPLGLDKDTGAVNFPGQLEEGAVVRLTRRDPERIVDGLRRATRSLKSLGAPLALLQFDCAGRGRLLFGEAVSEHVVAPIVEEFPTTPIVGFHTYGEIGPLDGKTYYHNYTVALLALFEEE